MRCEFTRHGHPDLGDPEAVDEAREFGRPRFGDRRDEVCGGLLGEALQFHELRRLEFEQFGHAADHALPDEEVRGFFSQSFDVEGMPRPEMLNPPGQLRGAGEQVAAERVGAAWLQEGPARRTLGRHDPRFRALAARLLDPLQDLWNHVPRPLHPHPVPLANVLAGDLFPVMQVRAAHRHAPQFHRAHEGDGGHDAGPSHAGEDVKEPGDLFPRRELECERPARVMRRLADFVPRGDVVEFDDDPIDLVLEVVAPLLDLRLEREDLSDVGGGAAPLVHGQPPLAQRFERGALGGRRPSVDREDVVDVDVERARRGDARVELPQRSGRRVARVRERRAVALEKPGVERLEIAHSHDDFGPQRQERRRVPIRGPQPERYRLDRADVLGHAFAAYSVSPGYGPREPAGFVDEFDRGAVQFRLDDVSDVVSERLAHPFVEPFERLHVGG